MLYVVATPIGNLKDISLRAIEVLKSVALIACEDTRHSRILLDRYHIQTPTTSYFQHNRITKGEYLLKLLKAGKDLALVSDAGTPGILDPGYHIINMCIKEGLPLTIIPGAVALVNALVISGKPSHRFIFEGFLPARAGARRNQLSRLAKLGYSVVFYESCHRILATLEDIRAVWGDKPIVCVRELTKKFEETIRGNASQIIEVFNKKKPRGELVLVI